MRVQISEVEPGTVVNWQSRQWVAQGRARAGGYAIDDTMRRDFRIISGDTIVTVLQGWAGLSSGQRDLVREAVADYVERLRDDDEAMSYDLNAALSILNYKGAVAQAKGVGV